MRKSGVPTDGNAVINPGEPWGVPAEWKLFPAYLKDLNYTTMFFGKVYPVIIKFLLPEWFLSVLTKVHNKKWSRLNETQLFPVFP